MQFGLCTMLCVEFWLSAQYPTNWDNVPHFDWHIWFVGIECRLQQNIARGKTAACNQQVWEQEESTDMFEMFTFPMWDLCGLMYPVTLESIYSLVFRWLCYVMLCYVDYVNVIHRPCCQSSDHRSEQISQQSNQVEFNVSSLNVIMDKRLNDMNNDLPFVCEQPDNHAFSRAGGRRGHRAQQSEHRAFAPSHPLG